MRDGGDRSDCQSLLFRTTNLDRPTDIGAVATPTSAAPETLVSKIPVIFFDEEGGESRACLSAEENREDRGLPALPAFNFSAERDVDFEGDTEDADRLVGGSTSPVRCPPPQR